MKRVILLLAALVGSGMATAQTQHSAYTAVGKGVATSFLRDYQALGINTSALGWGTGVEGKNFTVGTQEFAFGISSPELDKERLRNFSGAMLNQIRDKDNADFDWNAQRDAAADYANAGISMSFDYNWLGGYYHNEKLGGIAFSIRENYSWFSQLNPTVTDLVFRGRTSSYFDSLSVAFNGDTTMIANRPDIAADTLAAVFMGSRSNPMLLSDITEGTKIKMLWNREYNFGWGRKVFGIDSTIVVYAGVGGRVIQSMAMFDLESNSDGMSMSSSISPFYGINYGDIAQMNPSAMADNIGTLPSVVGNGYGIDLSASVILFNRIRIATSVNNIGSVTYTRNLYSLRDTTLSTMTIPGLGDNNVTESMNQMMEGGGMLNLQTEDKIVVANPALFRLGGSIELIRNRLDVGVDVVAPFDRSAPGSLQNAIFAVGGDVRVLKWLQFNVGYLGGGIYQHNIPIGVNFILGDGAYEVGISSRDALSFFLSNSNSISTAFGFARFRF